MNLGYLSTLKETLDLGHLATKKGVVGAPRVTITADKPNPTDESPITFTLLWSEPVTTDFLDDVVIGNGTIDTSIIDDTYLYRLEVIPDGAGNVTVDIPAGVCWDFSGNANLAADTFTIEYAP